MVSALITRIRAGAAQQPEELALAIVTPGAPPVELSWRDLLGEVRGYAVAHRAAGVVAGDTVFVLTPSVREQIGNFLGAVAVGAVPTILSYPSVKQSREAFLGTLRPIVEHIRPRWIACADEFLDLLHGFALPALRSRVPPPHRGEVPFADVGENLFLQFSSGTTGLRKGVAVSEAMLAAQSVAYGEALALRPDDRVVSWLPLYHDMGLVGALLFPLFHGLTAVHMSPFDWLREPATLLRSISRYRGTITFLPNFAYPFLASRVDAAALGAEGVTLASLRVAVNCSEPVRPEAHDAFRLALGPLGLDAAALQASYAMAENTFAVTQTRTGAPVRVDSVRGDAFSAAHRAEPADPAGSAASISFVSCGRPIADTGVRIAGGPAERRVGEIEITGPCVVIGYVGVASRDAFTEDGWFRTGDLGYVADGELFVTGRAKDLIIHRGVNVYPGDVEETIEASGVCRPGRVVVFGVESDGGATEDIVALFETGPDAGPDAEVAVATARRRVVEQFGFALRDAAIVPPGSLEKSTSGKLSRSANRAAYLEAAHERSRGPARAPRESEDDDGYYALSDRLTFEVRGSRGVITLPDGEGVEFRKHTLALVRKGFETPRAIAFVRDFARTAGLEDQLARLQAGGGLVRVDLVDDFKRDDFYGVLTNPDSQDLICQFRGGWYDVIDGVPPREFARLTGIADHNLVMLRDRKQRFYHEGVAAELPTFDALLAWLRGFSAALSPRVSQLHCVGTSMGGYAAIAAGQQLGAAHVWAFSPAEPPGGPDLAALLARDNGVTVFEVWYGKHNARDRRAVEPLRGLPRVRLHPWPTDNHLVALEMRNAGMLPRLLAAPAPDRRPAAGDGDATSTQVLEVLRGVLPPDAGAVAASTPLRGLLDSFTTVQLLSRLQSRLGLAVDVRQVGDEDLQDADAIVSMLRRLRRSS